MAESTFSRENLENTRIALKQMDFSFVEEQDYLTVPNIKGAKYVFNIYILVSHYVTFIGELPLVASESSMLELLRAMDLINDTVAVGNFELKNKQLAFKVGLSLAEPVSVESVVSTMKVLTYSMEHFAPLLSKVIDRDIEPEAVIRDVPEMEL